MESSGGVRNTPIDDAQSSEAHYCLGNALKAEGRFDEAVAAYRRAVDLEPGFAGAHASLGTVLLATNDPGGAVAAYQRAIAQRPGLAEAQAGLGTALMALKRYDQAATAFRRATDLRPDYAMAHRGLGGALLRQGNPDGALPSLQRAIALKPDDAEAHAELGSALKARGRLDEAVAACQRAIALSPHYAAAYAHLGNARLDQKRYDDAIAAYRRTIAIDDSAAEVHNNLGNALKAKDRLDEAIAAYRAAVDLRPGFAEAHSNLGVALAQHGKYDDAIASYRTAIDLRPDYADAYTSLGNTLVEQGRFEEAMACHDEALTLHPGDADAHCNKAYPLLALGRFHEGWREYEHRQRKAGARTLLVAAPPWDGGALAGKTIVVHAEQGVGDEILFASCLPDLIAGAGHCLIECEPRLGGLFARSFPTATVGGRRRADLGWLAEAPPVDAYVMQGSLMRHFRPSLESFPDHGGYLLADTAARDRFADRLAALGPGLKVGISWRNKRGTDWRDQQGAHWNDTYTAIEEWRDILTLAGVRFVNLQYDGPGAELANVEDRFGVHVHDFADLDLMNDFDGVAALISALDLVIAPGNTVAALAGALGAPVWMLTLAPNWCMFGTDRYPWFPSVTPRLRAIGADDWGAALDGIARDLGNLATAHRDDGARPAP